MKRPKTKTIQLPNKPSALLDLALKDLIKTEKDKKYIINMGDWHLTRDFLPCCVCLAGAVIAKTLEWPIDKDYWPASDSRNDKKLMALEYLRTGDVYSAISTMGLDLKGDYMKLDRDIVGYDESPKDFKKQIQKLVKDLKTAGL